MAIFEWLLRPVIGIGSFNSTRITKLTSQEMEPCVFRAFKNSGPFRPNLLYKIQYNQYVGHKCDFLSKRL